MSEAVISIRDLSKWYGEVIGLAGFSAEIGPGVTGLLGPNGAGKSTLFKCLAGLVRPDRGTVRVLGQRPFGNPKIFRRIGMCPEIDPFYERMTGVEYVRRVALWAGFDRREAKRHAEIALERVGMSADGCKKIAGMSKGMRQRTKFAQAIVHDPEILFLDEPLTGMDPVQRHHVMRILREYDRSGRTILVSSHVLHEIEAMTDRVLLLREGKLLAEGRVAEIRNHFENVPRRIHVVSSEPRSIARLALNVDSTVGLRLESEKSLQIETRRPDELLSTLTQEASRGSITVQEIFPADEDLSAVFGLLES